MPTISVIVPVYNTMRYLGECLDSVLAQTFTDFECICIDDGSEDNSATILREYATKDKRIRVITQKNKGVLHARTVGIMEAKAPFIYMLDSDDMIARNALEKLYAAMLQGKGDIITNRVSLFGTQTGDWNLKKPTKVNMAVGNCLVNAALMRKEDFIACGGFSKEFAVALEDYDLWLNLIFRHHKKIYRVNEVLFFYRIKSVEESRNLKNIWMHPALMQRLEDKYRLKKWKKLAKLQHQLHKFLRIFGI